MLAQPEVAILSRFIQLHNTTNRDPPNDHLRLLRFDPSDLLSADLPHLARWMGAGHPRVRAIARIAPPTQHLSSDETVTFLKWRPPLMQFLIAGRARPGHGRVRSRTGAHFHSSLSIVGPVNLVEPLPGDCEIVYEQMATAKLELCLELAHCRPSGSGRRTSA